MQNELQVMDPTGHTTVSWRPNNDEEVEVARETFARMTARGYRAFRVGTAGRKGAQISDFDPDAKKMILIPHLVGG